MPSLCSLHSGNRNLKSVSNAFMEDEYAEFGIPMHLREVGIDESRINEMAHHVAKNEGLENAWAPLTEKDIADIFRASL